MKDKNEKENKCAQCDKKFKGCPCHIKKAEDGLFVHTRCLQKYNHILRTEKEKEKGVRKEDFRIDG